MPTCTLCSYCTLPGHVGPAEHIIQKNPSCTMVDPAHDPALNPHCTCKLIHATGQWIHGTPCPVHP